MFPSFLFFPFVFSRDFSLSISGSGLHRSLHVTIPANSTSALLKWDITPDFYVDVYELDRQKFEFRVDDDDTKFIDIESPAHRSEFHRLSLNVERKSVTVPFHLRYQPPSDDDRDEAEILVPSPQLEVMTSSGLRFLEGDPFYVTIPVGNTRHLPLVTFSTVFTVLTGSLFFLRALFASNK